MGWILTLEWVKHVPLCRVLKVIIIRILHSRLWARPITTSYKVVWNERTHRRFFPCLFVHAYLNPAMLRFLILDNIYLWHNCIDAKPTLYLVKTKLHNPLYYQLDKSCKVYYLWVFCRWGHLYLRLLLCPRSLSGLGVLEGRHICHSSRVWHDSWVVYVLCYKTYAVDHCGLM